MSPSLAEIASTLSGIALGACALYVVFWQLRAFYKVKKAGKETADHHRRRELINDARSFRKRASLLNDKLLWSICAFSIVKIIADFVILLT